jgi:hypothetical protein
MGVDELNEVLQKLELSPQIIADLESVNDARILDRIFNQFRLIAEGQLESNIHHSAPGVGIKSVDRTYRVVFQKRSSGLHRILGITNFTSFESLRDQSNFISEREASFED